MLQVHWTSPLTPFDAIGVAFVGTIVIQAIQVRSMASFVPPGTTERDRTISCILIMVLVEGGEAVTVAIAERVPTWRAQVLPKFQLEELLLGPHLYSLVIDRHSVAGVVS